jgi:hypothetical protein
MLSNSDFMTGAFSPEYGNVFSGVFDMKLRTGNNEKKEYSIGLGVLGTDMTFEGPLSKNYSGSYLFNYRYSSLALLDNAGIVDFDGVPKYQDVSFKVLLPTKKHGVFSLFGLGGLSHIYMVEEDLDMNVIEKDDYSANLGVVGLNYSFAFTDNMYLKSSVSVAHNGSGYEEEIPNNEGIFYNDNEGQWGKSTLRFSSFLNKKFSAKSRLLTGFTYTHYFYDLTEDYYDEQQNRKLEEINLKKDAGLIQGFFSWKYRINSSFSMVSGLHYINFLLNNKSSVEPRIGVNYKIDDRQSINAGFGIHSKIENIGAYYCILYDKNGNSYTPNTNLDLLKANHYVIGYEYQINKNLNSKIELYYQNLYDIPVENVDTSYYSIINSNDGYASYELVNEGTGYNYGIEITLERYFADNFYFLFTSSLYDSKYKSKEGKLRNTRYNGNYAFNFLVGKEFSVGAPSKNRTLSINSRMFYSGGRRYIPVNLEASRNAGNTKRNFENAYNDRLDRVFQINLALSLKRNRPKATHEILVDIVNVTNNKSRIDEYYNSNIQNIDYDKQLNIIPNIMYRIHF